MHREYIPLFRPHSKKMSLVYSDFRQVPDTQEVLLFPNSDISLIVEILEKVAPSGPKDAAK